MDFSKVIESLRLKDGRLSPKATKILKTKYSECYSFLMDSTHFLPANTGLAVRIHCIENNITSQPLCPICDKPLKYQPTRGRFAVACSVSHAAQLSSTIEKRKQTNIERYGGVTPSNHTDKTQRTMMERYGVIKPLQNATIQRKRKNTLQERYGDSNCNRVDSIVQRRKETNFNKYGTEHASQRNITDQLHYLQSKDWLHQQHVVESKSCVQIANELGVGATTVLRAVKSFGLLQSCNRSSYEHEVATFLSSIGVTHIANDRTIIAPKEIDLWCPDYNIALEICGHYWHSELYKDDRNYHLNKMVECSNKGIRLIQIFEYDWVHKQDIIKRRLQHIFHKTNNVIYARNCSVVKIPIAQANDFMERNHIQGKASCSISYGLINNDNLIGAITFGKPRFNSNYEYELIRLAFSDPVIGGASKLFSRFVKDFNPSNVLTYSDLRWNTGTVYEKMGFVYKGRTKPNYWYFQINDSSKIYNRMLFQKHKLKSKLDKFDPTLSEAENMFLNNYSRIWDCGNAIWEWKK